jgi:hypothetical protein
VPSVATKRRESRSRRASWVIPKPTRLDDRSGWRALHFRGCVQGEVSIVRSLCNPRRGDRARGSAPLGLVMQLTWRGPLDSGISNAHSSFLRRRSANDVDAIEPLAAANSPDFARYRVLVASELGCGDDSFGRNTPSGR